MRLTSYTDYALRTLMHLAINRENLVTIQDIAEHHVIAKNHLSKVVHQLGQLGLVETLRGRNGGLKLACEPKEINIGTLVRQTETDFYMAECFERGNDNCPYLPSCALKGVLGAATKAYFQVLDDVTLDQLLGKSSTSEGKRDLGKPIRFQAAKKK